MSFSLFPRFSFKEVKDISPGFLGDLGIRLLMIDLDNTLAAYCEHSPADDVFQWVTAVKDAGINLAIVSNSSNAPRVGAFAVALDTKSIIRASKPSPASLLDLMETAGFSAGESALVGDQIFTDTLAANRAGVLSIIVKPRKFTNPLLALRYAAEMPFRAFAKNRQEKSNEQYRKNKKPSPRI